MLATSNDSFLIERDGSPYPPHHFGEHLEEYSIHFFKDKESKRKLIPVHWTAVYNYRAKEGLGIGTPNGKLREQLQIYLDSLDRNESYFIVCTHDDAPNENLPPNTLVFGAGGNSNKIDVPIPLTCAKHQNITDRMKVIPVSFVGSVTHNIRFSLLNELNGKQGVFINASHWSSDVSNEKIDLFKTVTEQSIFSLCPRGYGSTSYRLYEAMQLGAIPVYVSDSHMLPWNDEIDWNEFCIVKNDLSISLLHQELMSMSGTKIRKMQDRLSTVWDEYFSIEATCKQILKKVT